MPNNKQQLQWWEKCLQNFLSIAGQIHYMKGGHGTPREKKKKKKFRPDEDQKVDVFSFRMCSTVAYNIFAKSEAWRKPKENNRIGQDDSKKTSIFIDLFLFARDLLGELIIMDVAKCMSSESPKLIPPFPIDRLFSILYFLSVIIITTHENRERDCKKRKERMKKKGGKKDNSIWFRICFYIRVFSGKKKLRKSVDGIFISLLLAVVFLFIYFFLPPASVSGILKRKKNEWAGFKMEGKKRRGFYIDEFQTSTSQIH